MIRPVQNSDAAALAGIYNYYIENTAFTLECAPVTAAQFERRIETLSAEFPYIVYADDETGELLGYAYLSRFHERYAYRFAVDLSIYVKKDAKRHGIGSAMLDCLRAEAVKRGYFQLISVITDENAVSVRFHEKHGFQREGHLPNVAWKFDHWLGVYHYRLTLQTGAPTVETPDTGAFR